MKNVSELPQVILINKTFLTQVGEGDVHGCSMQMMQIWVYPLLFNQFGTFAARLVNIFPIFFLKISPILSHFKNINQNVPEQFWQNIAKHVNTC